MIVVPHRREIRERRPGEDLRQVAAEQRSTRVAEEPLGLAVGQVVRFDGGALRVVKLESGHAVAEAALEASRQRLRPILMTSLAFMMGVLPLAYASGAGSGSQRAIGVGVLLRQNGMASFGHALYFGAAGYAVGLILQLQLMSAELAILAKLGTAFSGHEEVRRMYKPVAAAPSSPAGSGARHRGVHPVLR